MNNKTLSRHSLAGRVALMLCLAATQANGQTPADTDLQPSLKPAAQATATQQNVTALDGTPLPIGKWDGVTASARLGGAYEDSGQLAVPFGIISYYNQPWRGYMDTWSADQYLNAPGASWNLDTRYAEPMCQLLQESGIRELRIEVGWGASIGWDDNLKPDAAARLQTLLPIFKRHGIRPLLLLNGHHGVPCPCRYVTVQVAAAARAGDHTLRLVNATGIRPGYTGIMHPSYIAAYPVVTSVSANGTASLSAGLPFDVSPGPLTLIDLKYQPFQGVRLADGTAVPAAQATFDGWVKYAAAVGRAARTALGTAGQADAGFDLEVWNELTFGSNFLDINNYYDNKFNFSAPFTYQKTRAQAGLRPGAPLTFTSQGCESILPMTVDYFTDPANGFPGVNVISGFSNTTPWASGSSLWPGQAGFSRHFYTGGWQDCTPASPISDPSRRVVDAQGNLDGQQVNPAGDSFAAVPGTVFVPTFRCAFPEYWESGFKTEEIVRDILPDSRQSGIGSWAGTHGRFADNGDFRPAQVWQSETNYWRSPFFDQLRQQTGVPGSDPRMLSLDQWMAGKLMLRQYIFHAHKGQSKVMLFNMAQDPESFGMVPPALLQALDQSAGAITDAVRQAEPPGFKALNWINATMSAGKGFAATCPLKINDLVEYKPRLVFAGDGTAAHPHRWNRDQFAFLPFQLSANQYAIPYYVVTLDVTHAWNTNADALDPARYDMPEQDFDVTIGNVQGQGATVTAYDPLKGTVVPVAIVASTPSTLTVRLKAVDYPRFLQVTEAKGSPQILQPQVSYVGNGRVKVSWRSNAPAKFAVTYGGDWTARSASTVPVPVSSLLSSSVTITGCQPGVTAVRIKATASNGVTTTWPRWDQDPAGQVVVPATP